MNGETGDKVYLRKTERGSYQLDVTFPSGERTSITVDSGAEENVCPWGWGDQFPTREVDYLMNFRGASGEYIGHYGQKDVVVASPF